MTRSYTRVSSWWHDRSSSPHEAGQGLAEYALILALIALVVIGAVVLLGGNIQTIMNKVAGSI